MVLIRLGMARRSPGRLIASRTRQVRLMGHEDALDLLSLSNRHGFQNQNKPPVQREHCALIVLEPGTESAIFCDRAAPRHIYGCEDWTEAPRFSPASIKVCELLRELSELCQTK